MGEKIGHAGEWQCVFSGAQQRLRGREGSGESKIV
jgi:hypothetical protein